jgi:hypothetical protein
VLIDWLGTPLALDVDFSILMRILQVTKDKAKPDFETMIN